MLQLRTGVVLAFSLLCAAILVNLEYPLLWNDETETAMYAERILEFGYPKIHDGRNTVYELAAPLEIGTKEPSDAYIGSTWGQYYFAVPGVAAARLADGLYTRTFLVRLPFALAALAGMAILAALGSLPFREAPARGARVAIAFLLLSCLSVPLQLHAQEARHYPVVLLLVAACAYVHAARQVGRRLLGAGGTLLLAVLFSLLFQFFPIAYYATFLGIGLDLLLRSLRDPAAVGPRIGRLLRGTIPLLLSLLTVIPSWIFYETFEVGRALYSLPEAIGVTAEPLRDVLDLLIRRELLLAGCLALGVRKALGLLAGDAPPSAAYERASQVSRMCWLIVLAHVALVAQLPFTFDRYVVAVPPLVCLATVLEASLVLELSARLGRRARLLRVSTLLGALALSAISWETRTEDLRNRLHELTNPYRGPLDFIIPAIQTSFPDTTRLTIATNYESTAFMYYLGARATVGFIGVDIDRDLALEPDVIVPRPWVENSGSLQ